MELKANRGELLASLQLAQSIVERRHAMPILANVLLESSQGDLRITATDLEVGVRGKLSAEVSREGSITVGARKFYEIVRVAPEETLALKQLENEWVEISSGRSVFRLVGLDAQEFPQFPDFSGEKMVPVPAETLLDMIEKTAFSVSTDDTRRSLNGALLEQGAGGVLRMVATDGHRLGLIEKAGVSVELEKSVILPRKGLSEMRKLLESESDGVVLLGFRENMGLLAVGQVQLYMRLIDGDFPEYDRVIPKESPYVLKVGREAVLEAIRRVAILSSERYKGIKMELQNGRMVVSASNPDFGEAVEELDIEYEGEPLSIGFNARYLMDILDVLGQGGEVEFQVRDEVSPGLLKKVGDDTCLYVVMPMRL